MSDYKVSQIQLRVPFEVYSVYEGFAGPELQSATVVRVTPQKWWFGGRTKLGFGCRTGCRPYAYPTSPEAAWGQLNTDALNGLEQAEDRVRRIATAWTLWRLGQE